MKTHGHQVLPCWVTLALVSVSLGQPLPSTGKMAFTISMEDPNSQCFQVVFRCEGLAGPTQDFKMPVWSPGYYGVFNFAANVQDFSVQNGRGKPLSWEKSANNTWRVASDETRVIVLNYRVKATVPFVANSYLDGNRGYIVPTDVCLHVDGQVQHPVTVKIDLPPQWSDIATGLDTVDADHPHTFVASNFDVLYDSPLLLGNLETFPSFEIQGVPHHFIGYALGDVDGEALMKELKAALKAGIGIIGDIPYQHYTFIGIGPGQGGIEHLNSTTLCFEGQGMDDPKSRIRTLNFLVHEYFHNYNVKRIRPIALGPFDYDGPNLTNMLWVSEGFTVYYEHIMMARAGLITTEEFLSQFSDCMKTYESNTGRLFQSVTESSYQTWTQGPFGEGSGGIRKTISYYNKGPILGLLLDLNIRHVTQNKKSLDDVMRALYTTFYQERQRGFTDEEFQAVCEDIAGCPLPELFAYASTTQDIDYTKYLGYAGLELDPPVELPEAYLGVIPENVDGTLVVAAVEWNCPARHVGLMARDRIMDLNGSAVDAKAFNKKIDALAPGDEITLSILRDSKQHEYRIKLDHKRERSYTMIPVADPTPLQAEILKSLTAPCSNAAGGF
jgi:predicted metalloprotease with PDZ domain